MKPNTVGGISGAAAPNPFFDTSGFMPEAILMTLDGEKCISDLQSGDRIITRNSGMAILRDVRTTDVTCQTVSIKAGSLGHTRPVRDVVLPAGQSILIRDWRAEAMFGKASAMVPAHRLVDEEFVILQEANQITLVSLVFDQPQVLYVDGLEVASDPSAAGMAQAA